MTVSRYLRGKAVPLIWDMKILDKNCCGKQTLSPQQPDLTRSYNTHLIKYNDCKDVPPQNIISVALGLPFSPMEMQGYTTTGVH